MIHAKTCFVAEGVTIDRDSNQVSAYNLIEDLQAPRYPLFLQKLAFFCLWERESTDPTQCRAEFSITLDGKDLVRQPIDIEFGAFLRNRCTTRLDGFSLAQPGTVAFRLAIPEHGVAEWTITAEVAAPDTAPGIPSASRNLWRSQPVTASLPLPSSSRK